MTTKDAAQDPSAANHVHLYERLSGPEKAALVRSWQRFSDALTAVQTTPPAPWDGDTPSDWNLARRSEEADLLAAAATKRAAYLWAIRHVWFRLTFQTGETAIDPVLSADSFSNGQDLDDILWEYHPVNLFQELEEVAGLCPVYEAAKLDGSRL